MNRNLITQFLKFIPKNSQNGRTLRHAQSFNQTNKINRLTTCALELISEARIQATRLLIISTGAVHRTITPFITLKTLIVHLAVKLSPNVASIFVDTAFFILSARFTVLTKMEWEKSLDFVLSSDFHGQIKLFVTDLSIWRDTQDDDWYLGLQEKQTNNNGIPNGVHLGAWIWPVNQET